MTFKEWIYGSIENPSIKGQWGWLHILTLILCAICIVTISLLFRKKSYRAKIVVIWVLASLIFIFEIARRIINFSKNTDWSANSIMHMLMPRPWCAISCWVLMASVVLNRKFFYNFASTTSLICAIIFFAYPGVGFNNKYIVFENLYSICTHSLILIMSILLITLKFTKFEYKKIWKEAICLVVLLVYVFLEIYVFKIEADPMYFMPNNDVMDILSLSYVSYVVVYIIFMLFYFNLFYAIEDFKSLKNLFKKRTKIKE